MPACQRGPTERRCTCETLGGGRGDTQTVTHKHNKYATYVLLFRQFRGLCLGKQGLSVSRCLLKQGEPKHNQTQVMKPWPSDLSYSFGAVYKRKFHREQ